MTNVVHVTIINLQCKKVFMCKCTSELFEYSRILAFALQIIMYQHLYFTYTCADIDFY